MMKVTNVQVYPVREPQGKLRAYARVVLDDQLQLTGMRVYEGSNGYFVSYPSDPTTRGEDYRQIFYPVTRELRDLLEVEILTEWANIDPEASPRIREQLGSRPAPAVATPKHEGWVKL